ncbi:hypothetical protein [Amycolatopsis palatopharyngis]|uniref:hypothetical protein n=1 Tax=Amycolatopsis palatopharyngis TaxID=187982 RepID=UPI001B86C4A2|nr:hypothetical protein [Amycolatopsis palatopharyngis]
MNAEILPWLGGVVAAIAILTAVSKVVAKTTRAIRRVWRPFTDFLEDWRGEPARPGRDKQPGAMERMQAIETRVTANTEHLSAMDDRLVRVEAEFRPNGGSSLRDSLNRVESYVSPEES